LRKGTLRISFASTKICPQKQKQKIQSNTISAFIFSQIPFTFVNPHQTCGNHAKTSIDNFLKKHKESVLVCNHGSQMFWGKK
jgi:hypothetical protein